ncbi:HNH endonuclease domain-containing protein [Shewanella mangrovisoli]|uniref:HNH endonuclease domain-containing protein n=1 Tax=Shewanella mangrovisoli TaxID=2864211 RepID=UPI0035BB256F
MDHAFPFARWLNNDLWNLLPTKRYINANKSDRLPAKLRMQQSKDWILDWWEIAWSENKNVFFTQTSFALPRLGVNTDQFSDVF